MKAYIITTGTIFGLIFVAHICRMFVEPHHVATDPVYIALTAVAAALCLWACRLLKSWPRS